LVKGGEGSFADAPSFSPDGNRVVYTAIKIQADGTVENAIHLIDADGKNDHAIVTPPDPKFEYNWGVFSRDGKWIYFTSSAPTPDSRQESELQRIPVEGGAAQSVLKDARMVTFSRDGKRITFTRLNIQNFTTSLWIADADGQNVKPLVGDDVFLTLWAQSFSPDGEWILFAASGPPSRPLPGALLLPSPPCQPELLCALVQPLLAGLAAPAYADGLPWDLWLVNSDGTRFQQLTLAGFDSPWPAWSRDGKYIAIFEITGLYVLDTTRSTLSLLRERGGHGALDWFQK
jgi:Tol biopolymer transport system component